MGVRVRPRALSQAACRAYRLRHLDRPLTDIEAAWLRKYARDAKRRQHRRKPAPTISPDKILAAAVQRFGVSAAALRRQARTGNNLDSDIMRAVVALALREVGASFTVIGATINRTIYAVSQLLKRTRGRRYLRREVEIVLQAARPVSGKGDVLWVTVRVEVGDPVWCAIDRRNEAAERSQAAIEHRIQNKRRDAE